MDFDYDPDEIIDEIEEMADAEVEEQIEEALDDLEEALESSDEGYGLRDAAVGAAIFGMAEEHGRDEAKHQNQAKKSMESKEFERPEGAVSLKSRKKESKKLPFEQWVEDVIKGKKSLDDDL